MSEMKIIVKENASLRVEGDVPLYDAEGNRIPTKPDKPYHLCRCGHSQNKPFCDSSHRELGFDGTLAER